MKMCVDETLFNLYFYFCNRLLVEQVVHMQVIPMWQETEDGRQMTPDQQRSDRVLTMYSSLDDSACR